MTEDEVIKLAREVGREMPTDPPGVEFFFYREELFAFVDIAVKAEREKCAKMLDEMAAQDKHSNYYVVAAKAIRARSNHEQH
jgi:hypothetical protein